MRKLKGILVLILLLALLTGPFAVLASNITGARYYGTIIVSNNSTATSNVAVNCTISTANLINGGYLNSLANNCVVRSSAGADLAFMPSVNASYPWCIWVPSIGQDSHLSDILYTANSTGGKIRYFPAAGGMTTVDSDSLEIGDNFTIEQSGWIDTTYNPGDVKLLADKPSVFRIGITDTEEITSLIVGDAWGEVAPKLGAETQIVSLAVYNGKLYGGTGALTGELYEWNGSNLWVQVAPQLGVETYIFSLAVYNDKLYGGTYPNGKLYEWNGSNLWVQVAPKLGAETRIASLAVYNGKLYGGTDPNGKLYEWNGSNLWVEVAPKLGAETRIASLAVYNGKLYGGTGVITGELYEWNGSNLWVQVAPQLGAETIIFSLAVYNDKLYGGTGVLTGELYEWNGSNLWVQVAPQLGVESYSTSLAVYNGKLYGGTTPNGKLYEWNGSNLWVEVAPKLGAEQNILSLAVYNGKLYGGTTPNGKLYEWNASSVTATGVSSGEYIVTTAANTTHMWIDIDAVTQDTEVLGGASVPPNNNDWTFLQNNVMPYMEYHTISVNGTQTQYIEWEYDDTTFSDNSSFGNDASPAFRTTSSDPDISAVFTSFLPISEAKAPSYALADAPAFIETVPTIVSEWDVTPVAGTFPLATVIAALATATGTPAQLPLLIIAGFVIIAFSLSISYTMRRYGSGSLIVKIIVITAVMGVFIALKNFGVEFWMLFVFLVIAIALAMGSKQVGWQ